MEGNVQGAVAGKDNPGAVGGGGVVELDQAARAAIGATHGGEDSVIRGRVPCEKACSPSRAGNISPIADHGRGTGSRGVGEIGLAAVDAGDLCGCIGDDRGRGAGVPVEAGEAFENGGTAAGIVEDHCRPALEVS